MIQLINILMEQAGYPINRLPCRVAKGHTETDSCISHRTRYEVHETMPDDYHRIQETQFHWDWYGATDDAE